MSAHATKRCRRALKKLSHKRQIRFYFVINSTKLLDILLWRTPVDIMGDKKQKKRWLEGLNETAMEKMTWVQQIHMDKMAVVKIPTLPVLVELTRRWQVR